MTREQAIIRLRRISNSLGKYCDVNDCIRGDCAKCYEALNMAEDALEQEPKRGEWIDHTDEGFVECPFCHSATTCEDNIDELKFCFSCGARMESEE